MSTKYIPKGKKILYAYILEDNHAYLKQLEKETRQPISAILDEMIQAVKRNKKMKLKNRVPKFVQKARDWESK